MGRRPRIVVCGTDFGRTYLAAVRRCGDFELAGILARGGTRSRRCAGHYGVPLFGSPDELPDDVDAACVVVGAAINGGPGGELARALMARGLHVLQEHPLDPAELSGCLRAAGQHGVVYQVGCHYADLPAVSSFLAAGRRLLTRQRPVFVDAHSSFLVLYPLVDVLFRLLGRIRPIAFEPATGPAVLRSVTGVLGGVPLALRVQHQMDPVTRDNGGHVLQRVTVCTEGGNLLLAGPAGPVLWSPRLNRPGDYADVVSVADSADAALDLPAVHSLPPAGVPSHRQVIAGQWPDAVGVTLGRFRAAIAGGRAAAADGQHHLGLAEATRRLVAALGPVQLVPAGMPDAGPASMAVLDLPSGSARLG